MCTASDMTEPQADDTPREPPPLTGLLDGFGGYFEPTPGTWDVVLRQGLVVLDANAILDAYRMSPHARDDYLRVLEALRERIFVPHQVAREFHQRRLDAVRDRKKEFEEFRRQFKQRAEQTKSEIERHAGWARIDGHRVKEVADSLGAAFARAQGLVSEVKGDYDLDPGRMARGDDPVLPRLEKIFEGRVNRRPPETLLQDDLVEARRRREGKIPPGFGDIRKEDSSGDYLWWAEVVRHVAADRRAVLIVTNDVTKGDWTFDHHGNRVGAHPFLVEEIHRVAGVPLLLATVSELLTRTQESLQTKVDESTFREVNALRELATGTGSEIGIVGSNAVPRATRWKILESLISETGNPASVQFSAAIQGIIEAYGNQIGESVSRTFARNFPQPKIIYVRHHGIQPDGQESQIEGDPDSDDTDAAGQ